MALFSMVYLRTSGLAQGDSNRLEEGSKIREGPGWNRPGRRLRT